MVLTVEVIKAFPTFVMYKTTIKCREMTLAVGILVLALMLKKVTM